MTFKKPLKEYFSANNSFEFENDNNEASSRYDLKVEENYKPISVLTPNNSCNIGVIFEDEEKNDGNNNFSNFRNKNRLMNSVQNILYNSNDFTPINEQKKIYNKFKNKFPFYRNKLNNQLNYPPFNSENEARFINLNQQFFKREKRPKIRLTNNQKKYDLDELLQTANGLRTLRDKSKIDKNILSTDNLLKKLKNESIFKTPKMKFRKKIILSQHEYFYYDEKKWKNGNSQKNFKNDIHFNEINKQITDTIKEMKNKVSVLNQEIINIEEFKNKMKSQKLLAHVKSKSFRNFKSIFISSEEKRKLMRHNSKFDFQLMYNN